MFMEKKTSKFLFVRPSHVITDTFYISFCFISTLYFVFPLANPCGFKPCKNGAECFNRGEKFYCKCKPEFMGVTCIERKSKLSIYFN